MATKTLNIADLIITDYDDGTTPEAINTDGKIKSTHTPGASGEMVRYEDIGGGGIGAPSGAAYIVVTLSGDLSAERRLQVGTGLTLTDGGANGDIDVDLDPAYGEISALDNSTATTISVAGTAVQVTIFDTDGISNNCSPDNTSDDITIDRAGDYRITVSATINSVSGSANRFELTVQKNNGASIVGALVANGDLAGSGSESTPVTIVGLATLALNDTIEVWIENETNTDNYVVENITLAVEMIG